MALGRTLVGMPAGWFAKQIGWPGYFVASTLVAIPGLALLLRYKTWQRGPTGDRVSIHIGYAGVLDLRDPE